MGSGVTFETDEELTERGVSLTVKGSPVWRPTDAYMFSAETGDGANGFAAIGPAVNCLYSVGEEGKNWIFDSGVPKPQKEHPASYEDMFTEALSACGHVGKKTFPTSDFTDKKGLFFTLVLMPNPSLAPQGSSPFFESGPLLGHSIFPITVDGELRREGVVIDPDFDQEIAALSALTYAGGEEKIPGEGFSHRPAILVASHEFVRDKITTEELPGDYELALNYTDATGSGWTVIFSFTLE